MYNAEKDCVLGYKIKLVRIKCVMSILHDLKEHNEDGLYYTTKKE